MCTSNLRSMRAHVARASAVLHATPAAAGHNSIGMPIHVLVGMAARGDDNNNNNNNNEVASSATGGGGSSVEGGRLPEVRSTPTTAQVTERRGPETGFDLGTGLGDGLGYGQRAAVLAAFRE